MQFCGHVYECVELTVDDDDVDHGSVSVRRPTHVDAGVGHATRPDYQHADQHRRLDLLRYDDAARRVRTHLLPVLHHTYMNQYKTYDHGIDGQPLLCYQGPVVVILTYTPVSYTHLTLPTIYSV